MSRIGKLPIPLPKGVEVTHEGSAVRVKGPKGELGWTLPRGIALRQEDDGLVLDDQLGNTTGKALHGTSRALLANMVLGVTSGFSKVLEVNGVGYRVQLQGKKLVFNLNYDHPIEYPLPEGITAEVADRPLTVTIRGIDKQLVGQVAANIRAIQKPDPYKGKGIKYVDEQVRRKTGKSAG